MSTVSTVSTVSTLSTVIARCYLHLRWYFLFWNCFQLLSMQLGKLFPPYRQNVWICLFCRVVWSLSVWSGPVPAGPYLILAPYDLPISAPFSDSWHQRWMFHVKEKYQTLKTSFPQLVFRAVKENQGRFLATTIDILCRNLWWDWFLAVQTGSVQVAEGEKSSM